MELTPFHGAAVVLGLGAPDSAAARRALKIALMLTQQDGPAYPIELTELIFSVAGQDDLQQRMSRLRVASEQSKYDTLYLYVAASLDGLGEQPFLRPCKAAEGEIALAEVVQQASHIEADSVVVVLDVCEQDRPEFSDEKVTRLAPMIVHPFRARGAQVAVVAGGPKLDAPARSKSGGENAPETLHDFFLDWMVGRNTSQQSRADVASLRSNIPINSRLDINIHVDGDAEKIRLGKGFPWLAWNKRTTIPGHAVASLSEFVDKHAGLLVDRLSKGALSPSTLAGMPNSLFTSLWREAQRGTQLDLLEKLERDRQIIHTALQENDMNRTATANAMGISRSTLYAKIRRLRIDMDSRDG